MLKLAHLRTRREPLQIPYPAGFGGAKSGHADDETLLISHEPRWLTEAEVDIVEAFLKKLPYRQALEMDGAVLIDGDDPLLAASQDDLDQAEASAQLPNTRYLPGGGQRSTRERVLILRERGYGGNGNIAISAGV
jgi:hypothetical protein